MFKKGAANTFAREDITKRLSQRSEMPTEQLIQYAVEEKAHNPDVAKVWDTILNSDEYQNRMHRVRGPVMPEQELRIIKEVLDSGSSNLIFNLRRQLMNAVYDSLGGDIPDESDLGSMEEEFANTPEKQKEYQGYWESRGLMNEARPRNVKPTITTTRMGNKR